MDLSCPCCNNPWHKSADTFAMSCEACADEENVAGLDPKNMDKSVSPAKNFFLHSNGTWMKNNPIPGEYPAWNTFTALHDKNLKRLQGMLESLPPCTADVPTTAEEKVSAFWAAALDEEAVEAAGLAPLEPAFAACDQMGEDPTACVARLHAEFGINVFFALGEGADDKRSEWTTLQLSQAGLGLPDRDYYLDEDKAEKREEYVKHVALIFTLLGESAEDAASSAASVMRVESSIAATHMTRTERRDPDTCYNKLSKPKLSALCKGSIEWKRYFELAGKAESGDYLICDNPPALAASSRLIATSSAAELRAYLRWQVAHGYASHLPKSFVDATFDFYSKYLSGQQEQKPRWKRAMAWVEGALGEAVGQLYVERFFSGGSKASALATVDSVRVELQRRLEVVEWMGSSTREKAIEKMHGFNVKIGFPDEWIDYSGLEVVRGDHLGNVRRARAFEHARQMKYANAPTDKTRWFMLPQQINAYYHPNLNEIVFPAAILQPPFFDAEADDAVNLGAMGAVVGHEMTHGFDDQGRQYDALGNLNDWWTKADAEEYERRVEVQVSQASRFTVYEKELNGRLTCGENIADLGGLKLAYAALQTKIGREGAPPPLNGFSAEQRFFLSWAQVWRENVSKERALQLVTLDPHGPNEYRTNGPLANMPEFHAAFGVGEGDAMFRPAAERVDIW